MPRKKKEDKLPPVITSSMSSTLSEPVVYKYGIDPLPKADGLSVTRDEFNQVVDKLNEVIRKVN